MFKPGKCNLTECKAFCKGSGLSDGNCVRSETDCECSGRKHGLNSCQQKLWPDQCKFSCRHQGYESGECIYIGYDYCHCINRIY